MACLPGRKAGHRGLRGPSGGRYVTTTRPDGDTATGPTVLRMLLGAQLRRLREANHVTREAAGWEIRASESKISRMELGRVGFKERDVADLLTLYGVHDDDRTRRAARTRPRRERARLVAPVRRRPTAVVPVVPRVGSRLGPHPHLRGPVRSGPAAEPGLRPRGGTPGPPGSTARGDRAPGRPADGPTATAHPRGPAATVGGGGRGRAAPADRRPRGDVRARSPP